jgi:MFS family permease
MVVLGGILGGIVGFLVGLLITEAIIGTPANSSGFDWQFWTDIVLAIVGVLVGVAIARRLSRSGATASRTRRRA